MPEQFPILLKRDQYVLAANKDKNDPWKKTSALERAVRTRCLNDDGFCLNSRNRLLTPSISIASTADVRTFALVIGAVRVASRLSHP